MEESRGDESERRKKSRERVEMTGDIGKKKRRDIMQRTMEKRKCFACGGFRYMANNYRNRRKERPVQVPSNKFEVLKSRVMQKGEESGKVKVKDRKEILKKERKKRGIVV